LYNTPQLIEITSLNQANGVKISLKIGSQTVVDAVDTVAGYLTNPGFLIFNAGMVTGTIYITDAALVTSVPTFDPGIEGVLFPNPNEGNIIKLKTNSRISKVEFLDMQGKLIEEKNDVPFIAGEYNFVPKVKLDSGVYFIRVFSRNKSRTYKIVVK
jgi:hypothetical protein